MTKERDNIKALIAKLVPSKQKKTQVVITDKDLSDILDILQEHTEVVSQRDELLAALKGMIEAYPFIDKNGTEEQYPAHIKAFAAIKRAEGGN